MKRLLLLLCCLSLSMHAMKKPLTFASVESAIETKSAQEAAAVLQKYVNKNSESGSRVAIQFWNAKYPTMKFKSSAFRALLAGEAPTVPEKPITPPVKVTPAEVMNAITTKSAQEAAVILQQYVNDKGVAGAKAARELWDKKYLKQRYGSSAFQALLAGEKPTVPAAPLKSPEKNHTLEELLKQGHQLLTEIIYLEQSYQDRIWRDDLVALMKCLEY